MGLSNANGQQHCNAASFHTSYHSPAAIFTQKKDKKKCVHIITTNIVLVSKSKQTLCVKKMDCAVLLEGDGCAVAIVGSQCTFLRFCGEIRDQELPMKHLALRLQILHNDVRLGPSNASPSATQPFHTLPFPAFRNRIRETRHSLCIVNNRATTLALIRDVLAQQDNIDLSFRHGKDE